MEKKVTLLKGPLVSLSFLFTIYSWIPAGHAFDSWLGEVGADVNLRRAPGLDQEVITVLEQGSIVEVMDENGDWYQVAPLWETPEHKGWVYGKYVRKTSPEGEITQGPAVISEKDKEAEVPLAAQVIKEEKLGEETKKAEETEAPLKAKQVTVIEPSPEVAELTEPEPSFVMERARKTETPLQPSEEKILPEIPSLIEKEKKEERKEVPVAKAETEQRLSMYQRISAFLRPLVRLSSIIISCLALIFAFKALRLAQACHQAVVRFQTRFQDPQEKDDQLESE